MRKSCPRIAQAPRSPNRRRKRTGRINGQRWVRAVSVPLACGFHRDVHPDFHAVVHTGPSELSGDERASFAALWSKAVRPSHRFDLRSTAGFPAGKYAEALSFLQVAAGEPGLMAHAQHHTRCSQPLFPHAGQISRRPAQPMPMPYLNSAGARKPLFLRCGARVAAITGAFSRRAMPTIAGSISCCRIVSRRVFCLCAVGSYKIAVSLSA